MPRAKWALAAAVILGGCATSPPLAVPSTPITGEYKHGAAWQAAQPGDHLPRGEWWRGFGDATLDALIERIDGESPTLTAAVARLDRATAGARVARAGLMPSIDLRGAASRERLSAGRPIGPGVPVTADQYVLGATLGYELDLWGRVRSDVRAGEAEAAAAAADLMSIRLSLEAAVADNYLRLRGLDAQQALLDRTVAAYTKADNLIRTRYDGGIASGVDISRSQTQLSSARARAEAIAAERAAVENAIAVLVGAMPSAFALPVAQGLPAMPRVTPGLPSTLLERRPDVARAERRLIAANARIGAARGALFPSLTLGLTGGFQATGLPVLSAPTSYWALGPLAAVFNLFDGGRRRAQVDVREAEYQEIAADYRQTVLDAFREVEDSLARSTALERQERELSEAARAASRTEALALDRYRDGASDFLDVVTAQTAALEAQQAYIDAQSQRRREAVTLVRALGGGVQSPQIASDHEVGTGGPVRS